MNNHWDLSGVYASLDEANAEGQRALAGARTFRNMYDGRIGSLSMSELMSCVSEYASLETDLCKLGSYAYLLHSTKLNDQKISVFFANIEELTRAAQKELVFLPVQICAAYDNNTVFETTDEGALAWLRNVLRSKPHTLSTEHERLFADQESVHTYWSRLYDETRAQMSVLIRGDKCSEGALIAKLHHHNFVVRHQAQSAMIKWYAERQDLFALIYNALVKSRLVSSDWHHYTYPEHASTLDNDIVKEDLDNLVMSVTELNSISRRYYALKAKKFGQKRILYADRAAPYPFAPQNIRYSLEEAEKLVLTAFEKFSPEFARIAQIFFDKQRIDFLPYAGKDSGAYCMEMPVGIEPFVFLNFDGTVGAIDTLAHELGHAVHEYVSKKYGELGRQKSCAQAETASVFAEQLVFKALLDAETDPTRRFVLLAQHLEEGLSTTFRQIAFHRFEHFAYVERQKGEVSAKRLQKAFKRYMADYLGRGVDLVGVENLWCSVPHFFGYEFYVYSYCFSACVVNSLYEVYVSGQVTDFAGKYMEMLERGGVEDYRTALKRFGIDASKPEFWRGGLRLMADELRELEKLAKQIR